MPIAATVSATAFTSGYLAESIPRKLKTGLLALGEIPSGTCEKIVLEFESGAGSKPIIPMFASKLKARQVEGMALQGHF